MSKHIFTARYTHGDLVFLSSDSEQKIRVVVKVCFFPEGHMMYGVVCGTYYSEHYEIELCTDKNDLITL